MKKILVFLLLTFLEIEVNAQLKRVTISEFKIAALQCKYGQAIEMDKNDTTIYFSIVFKNEKYSSISDFVSVVLLVQQDSSEVYDFLKDLNAAFVEIGNKTSINWDRDNYRIAVHDNRNTLSLYEPESKGSGCTSLNKKQVEKLISWFENTGYRIQK